MVVLFFVTRHLVLRFGSASDSIVVGANGMAMDTAVELIDSVEKARFTYITEISKG